MPDEQPQGGATGGEPGASQQQQTPPQQSQQHAQDIASLPQWVQEKFRKLTDESAQHRIKAKDRDDLATKLKELEDAQLSELDRAKKTATEAEERLKGYESQLRQERTGRAFEREAQKLGVRDTELAYLAVQGKIEYDKDGNATNLGVLIENLLKEKPYLANAASTGAGASMANPGRSATTQGQTFTKAQIAEMSSEEYEKNRTAITRAIKEGRILD